MIPVLNVSMRYNLSSFKPSIFQEQTLIESELYISGSAISCTINNDHQLRMDLFHIHTRISRISYHLQGHHNTHPLILTAHVASRQLKIYHMASWFTCIHFGPFTIEMDPTATEITRKWGTTINNVKSSPFIPLLFGYVFTPLILSVRAGCHLGGILPRIIVVAFEHLDLTWY